jgi:hypothetical protein
MVSTLRCEPIDESSIWKGFVFGRCRLRLFLTIASSTNAEQNFSQLKDPRTFHFSFAIAEA